MQSQPIDAERRAAIRARCAAATEIAADLSAGGQHWRITIPPRPDNSDLILIQALADVPDLLTALEEQEARNQELSRRLALAWSTNNAMEAERQGKLSAMLDGLYTDIARLCEERKRLRQTMLAIVENPQHVDVPLVVQMLRDALGEAAPAGEA